MANLFSCSPRLRGETAGEAGRGGQVSSSTKPSIDSNPDRVENPPEVPIHVVIREADNHPAFPLKIGRPSHVVSDRIVRPMRRTVDLDNQTGRYTREVCDEWADGVLSSKSDAPLNSFVQARPHDQLSFGESTAQVLRQRRCSRLDPAHMPPSGGCAAGLPPQAGGARYGVN
jgi:hypothetical protein